MNMPSQIVENDLFLNFTNKFLWDCTVGFKSVAPFISADCSTLIENLSPERSLPKTLLNIVCDRCKTFLTLGESCSLKIVQSCARKKTKTNKKLKSKMRTFQVVCRRCGKKFSAKRNFVDRLKRNTASVILQDTSATSTMNSSIKQSPGFGLNNSKRKKRRIKEVDAGLNVSGISKPPTCQHEMKLTPMSSLDLLKRDLNLSSSKESTPKVYRKSKISSATERDFLKNVSPSVDLSSFLLSLS